MDIPVLYKMMTGELNTDFPIACSCGMLVVTNEKMTDLKCCNELCATHKSMDLAKVLGTLGIQCNVGGSKSEDILNELQCGTHMDIFDPDILNGKSLSGTVVLNIKKIQLALNAINKEGGIPVSTYMKLFRFNLLAEGTCNKLFSGYSDIKDFYDTYMDDIRKCKNYIGACLNISPYTPTVEGVYRVLSVYKYEILRYTKFFKFCSVSEEEPEITICITKSITRTTNNGKRFSPRQAYVDYLIKKYHRNFIFTNSFNLDTHFLICDVNDNTPKLKKASSMSRIDPYAIKMKSENPDIQLGCRVVKSDEFEEMVKNHLV